MKSILIIGAGPAGLTSGFELIKAGHQVTILEADPKYLGGISRTVKYKDYRFDIGGHRFFSKNQEVMQWWSDRLDEDFLQRPRLSRWYYRGKFFHYPIEPLELVRVLGIFFTIRILISYLWIKLRPIKPEISLADWCINNFGRFLAKPFFIDYNIKLWGIDPNQLSKDFTEQRIRGLSFTTAAKDALTKIFSKKSSATKSLITTFNYPKFGPGQMWEKVADLIKDQGGKIIMDEKVIEINYNKNQRFIIKTLKGKILESDYLLSTMPLKELVQVLKPIPPKEILNSAKALIFRDFITVALMFNNDDFPLDNWIYTHDEGMRCIRIQLFKNWSPYMVPDKTKACIGFEYVTAENEELWEMNDQELVKLALADLSKLKFAKNARPIESTVVRLKNVYPRYDIGYEKHVALIKEYLQKTFPNNELQPMGRGGLHRYNNSDHSMMTAFLAVDNITKNKKYDQWNVNSEAEYHEEEK
ncbi:MAG: NAD(P)/FAD-dependent oxidoreductase [bacterium]